MDILAYPKTHPITSVGIAAAAILVFVVISNNSAGVAAPASGSGIVISGPSDAQVAAASNLAVAQQQTQAANYQTLIQSQQQVALAAIAQNLGLAQLQVQDNADSRAESNAGSQIVAGLQALFDNNKTTLGVNQSNNAAGLAIATTNNATTVKLASIQTPAQVAIANADYATQLQIAQTNADAATAAASINKGTDSGGLLSSVLGTAGSILTKFL